MENLIFSLNATIPIFLVMVIGYLLKFTKLMSSEAVNFLNRFNFNLTLPVLLFMDLATADFYTVWDTKYVLFCFTVTLLCILLTWLLAFPFFCMRSKKKAVSKTAYRKNNGSVSTNTETYRDIAPEIAAEEELSLQEQKKTSASLLGEFVQGCYRSSAAVLGIAFISGIYGHSVIGPMMILGTVPLYNIMAVIILSFTDPKGSGINKAAVKKSLLGILKNPIIISIVSGMIFSLLRINLPYLISKPLNMIAQIATPLALLGLGAGFEGRKAIAKIGPTMAATFIKLILQCAVFLPLAVSMGFRNEHLVALLVMLGAPTTVSCYIMAKNMNHEGVLTSSIVVCSTFFSSLTLTFWLYVLRSFGLI